MAVSHSPTLSPDPSPVTGSNSAATTIKWGDPEPPETVWVSPGCPGDIQIEPQGVLSGQGGQSWEVFQIKGWGTHRSLQEAPLRIVVVGEYNRLSPDELGWELVHGSGRGTVPGGGSSCFRSQCASDKQRSTGRERGKKGMGEWMSEQWVGGELTECVAGWDRKGMGVCGMSTSQYLCPCLPRVYKLPHPDTDSLERYMRLSWNPASFLGVSVSWLISKLPVSEAI